MELIQWERGALLNLQGNTNGVTSWLLCFLDSDQTDLLLTDANSLASFHWFAQHCIASRIVGMRNLVGNIYQDWSDISFADVDRLFHHRGTVDIPNDSAKRLVPTSVTIDHPDWASARTPFHTYAIISGGRRTQKLSLSTAGSITFEFHAPQNISQLVYAHAGVAATRPSSLRVEYLVEGNWLETTLTLSVANTNQQILNLSLANCEAVRLRVLAGVTADWQTDLLYFISADFNMVVEEVKAALLIPLPIAGHPTPATWSDAGTSVLSYDVSELKLNTLFTDRLIEMNIMAGRLEASVVIG